MSEERALPSDLAGRLEHRFARPDRLSLAMVHSSFAKDHTPPLPDNQRLEFLGDAVLALVVTEALMAAFPGVDEGALSAARADLVQAKSLARHARTLRLGESLSLGPGEERQGGRDKDSILADAFEAVVGSIHEDGGIEASRAFLRRVLADDLARRAPDGGPYAPRNPRSALQELLQAQGRGTPSYLVTEQEGPDHAPLFRAEVRSGAEAIGRGEGTTKQQAFESAAANALDARRSSLP